MRHRPRSRELGQTSIEYLGIIVAVFAIVGVMLTAAPDLGHTISCKIEGQISSISGGTGSVGCADVRGEPTEPCVITDNSGQLKASITAFSIKGGGEVKILREKLSDGKERITLSGGGNIGLEAKGGASGGIDFKDFTAKEGTSGSASVSLKGEGGGIYEFDNKAQADEFVDILQNKARDGAINAVGGPLGQAGTFLFGEKRDLPGPTSVYIQGGVGGQASGETGAGLAYATGGLDASAIVGARKNLKTGETTVYYTLKGSGELNAGALVGAGGQAGLEGQMAVTVDKNGKPVKAQVIAKGDVSGTDFDGDAGQFRGLNPSKLVEKFRGKGSGGQEGYRGEIRGTLDLRDPNGPGAKAFSQFLDNPLTGTGDLVGAFGSDATWDARVYAIDRDKYGADVKFGEGLAFGLEGGYEGVESDLKGAWYWGPNSGGIQQWATCSK